MIHYKVPLLLILPLLFSCASDREMANKNRIENVKARIISEWDLNLDGTISCDDLGLKKVDQFTKADSDGNNILDASEFKNAPWGSKTFAVEMLYSFDENRDGKVTQQEFSAKPNTVFAALDKNQNCTVSEDEIEASLTERRGSKSGGRGGRRGGKGGKGGGHLS